MIETWKREELGSRMDKLLMHWKDIERKVRERREPHGRSGGFGASGHSHVSDPTAAEAIRLAEVIPSVKCADGTTVEQPEAWLRVFQVAYETLAGTPQDVMRRRYRLFEPYICTSLALHISDRTYYSFLDEVRSYVVMVAIQYGLIRVV